MKKFIPYILTIIFLFSCAILFGQEQLPQEDDQEVTSCTQNLRKARTLYEEGKLNEIPSTLNACLNSGFTPQEKIEAYRLIAITYLYLDDPTKADEAMLNLLKTNPEYVVNGNLDPAEYINLYRSFDTRWKFRYGLKIGGNYTIPHIIESLNPTNPGEFAGQIGIQAGILMEFDRLVPKVVIQPELNFTAKSFGYSSIPTNDEAASDEDINAPGSSNINYTGNLSYIELFVTGKYRIWKDLGYFVSLSPGVGYLLTAEFPSIENNNEESPKYDLTESYPGYLNQLNPQLFIGGGTEVKFGRFYALAEVRYGYSFMSLINDRNAIESIMLRHGIPGAPDKLHSLTFSISFLRAIYNPKKITN